MLKEPNNSQDNLKDSKNLCLVEGCNELSLSKGYCSKHYQALRRGTLERNINKSSFKTCRSPGCSVTKLLVHGYCSKHLRQLRYDDPSLLNTGVKKCKEDSCVKVAVSKGYCVPHYNKFVMTPPEKRVPCTKEGCSNFIYADGLCYSHWRKVRPLKLCSVEGCSAPLYAKGYCRNHYELFRRHGVPYTLMKQKTLCEVEGCSRYSKRGDTLCRVHRNRFDKYGSYEIPDIKGTRYTSPPTELQQQCKEEGCMLRAVGRGYCMKHYQKRRRAGEFKVLDS